MILSHIKHLLATLPNALSAETTIGQQQQVSAALAVMGAFTECLRYGARVRCTGIDGLQTTGTITSMQYNRARVNIPSQTTSIMANLTELTPIALVEIDATTVPWTDDILKPLITAVTCVLSANATEQQQFLYSNTLKSLACLGACKEASARMLEMCADCMYFIYEIFS